MSAIGRNKNIISLQLKLSVSAEATRLFFIINDVAQWPVELEPRLLKSQPNSKVVAALPDLSRPEFSISSTEAGTLVTLNHDLIKSEGDKMFYSKVWKAWFKLVNKRVSI